jgi:Trk-type K+ transport system membrane component
LILVVLMIVGRIGPLALGLAMTRYAEGDHYRYPREQVTIG